MTSTIDHLLGGKNDLTAREGSHVDAITLCYGLSQLIREPTHILLNSSSCINLMFINQSNFIIDSGVNATLHPNPVDTRRRFNVYKTSIQRWRRHIDVMQTLKRRFVSTGNCLCNIVLKH